MSELQKTINMIIGLVLSFVAGYFLYALGELAHIDLSYGELDSRGKIELWAWRIFCIVAACVLFAWVVRKNAPFKK